MKSTSATKIFENNGYQMAFRRMHSGEEEKNRLHCFTLILRGHLRVLNIEAACRENTFKRKGIDLSFLMSDV